MTTRSTHPADSATQSPYANAVADFLDIAVEELAALRAKITPDYFRRAAELILHA
jgi:DNA-binding MurR/RpiR family transcriptional regulator